jgi:hypothetical protein
MQEEFTTVDPYFLKTGDIVQFKDKEYYFQASGSMGLLYQTRENLKNRINPYCVAREKLSRKKNNVEPLTWEETIGPVSQFTTTSVLTPEQFEELRSTRKVGFLVGEDSTEDSSLNERFSSMQLSI